MVTMTPFFWQCHNKENTHMRDEQAGKWLMKAGDNLQKCLDKNMTN